MEEALLRDEACGEVESLSQVDGACDSPYTQPGKCVEVEGVELEKVEGSMKGWCQVRRKRGQEEKVAAAETWGWEEFRSKYPYLAHYWRRTRWDMERKELEMREGWRREAAEQGFLPTKSELEKWLRGGGVLEEEEFYSD